MDEDLNELLLKKIKLNEDEPNETIDSMDYSNSDEDESRSRELLINLLRSYLKTKTEKKQREKETEDEMEDAQMFKSIRSMMVECGGLNSSNTTSTEEENDDTIDQSPEYIDDDDGLPSNLIVTGLPSELFSSAELKKEFEMMFTRVHSDCRFGYFKLFRRCCVQFDEPMAAVLARLELDRVLFMNTQLKMFLNKPIKLRNTRPFLEPPKNEKGFLISPPSSPPVGWEQNIEDPPVVNYDLLVALSKLDPHEPCELVKSNDLTPGIIVHPCPDEYVDDFSPGQPRNLKFLPTRRPPNYMN